MLIETCGDGGMALGTGVDGMAFMAGSAAFQGVDQISAQADVAGKAVAIMYHVHRISDMAVCAVTFGVG